MAHALIRDRLVKLENKRRFLEWFVRQRIYRNLTLEELETYASSGRFPDPIPNRESSFDTLDRKSLLKLWEDDEGVFGGRSPEELDYYAENGFWPGQRGRLCYSLEEGRLIAEWRDECQD